jgi:hypothetical protein
MQKVTEKLREPVDTYESLNRNAAMMTDGNTIRTNMTTPPAIAARGKTRLRSRPELKFERFQSFVIRSWARAPQGGLGRQVTDIGIRRGQGLWNVREGPTRGWALVVTFGSWSRTAAMLSC